LDLPIGVVPGSASYQQMIKIHPSPTLDQAHHQNFRVQILTRKNLAIRFVTAAAHQSNQILDRENPSRGIDAAGEHNSTTCCVHIPITAIKQKNHKPLAN
jgi:hypothetical protein